MTLMPHDDRKSKMAEQVRAGATAILRTGGEMAGRGAAHAGTWWKGIAAWYRFVHYRRADTRFAIFPHWFRFLEAMAILVSAVLLLVLFADPLLLAAMNTPGWTPQPVFEWITWFGKTDWILYPTGVALIGYSLWRRGGIGGKLGVQWHSIMLATYFLFTSVAFSGLLTNLFKILFGRARPPHVGEGAIWDAIPFHSAYEYASFPSGHATTAGAFAIAMALLFPRLRVFFLLAGVWIAISRPALGVHFPSDVLAGFCFGGAFSYYYARSFARKRLLFAFDDAGGVTLHARQSDFVPGVLRGKAGQ